jgi:hypothetical protein
MDIKLILSEMIGLNALTVMHGEREREREAIYAIKIIQEMDFYI